MELILNNQHKFAEIWLTNTDQADPTAEAQAQHLCREWHAKGFLPVIFRSGKEDLAEMTSALLVSNRDRMARRETEVERAAQKSEPASVFEPLEQKSYQRSATLFRT